MKATQYLFAALMASTMLFSSCGNSTQFPEEIAALDSLKTELSGLKNSLAEYNTEKLMEIDSLVQIHANTLDAGIGDTLSKEEWMLLGNYTRAINKRLGQFDTKLDKLKSEVDTSLKKIDDLSTDLKHNAFERPQAMRYLDDEVRKCVELQSAEAILKEKSAKATELYYEQREKVDSLMARINARMQDEE